MSDEGIGEILNRYKPNALPQPPPPQQTPPAFNGAFPILAGDSALMAHMMGRMQADLDRNRLGGIQLNFGSDILKWLVLLTVVVILVVALFFFLRKNHMSPTEHRLRKMEKQLKRLRKKS